MKSHIQSIVLLAALALLAGWSNGQSPSPWVFEGLITESDPQLAPELQSGWVLSGSFLLDGLQAEEQFVDESGGSGRFAGGITEAELTVDLYHQVLFEAFQDQGLAGFDFQDNNPEQDGRDLFGWFFPLVGELGTTGWHSTWLQIWLMDPEGDMIPHTPVQISPFGIEWKSGWFRLTFVNQEGDSVFADGRMELFSPESQLDDSSGSQWYSIASDLSRKLLQRDSTIKLLEKEMTELKQRIDGLRRMVDLLVEERSSLQEDNALLRIRAEAADPEVLNKVAELTAEKSLLQTHIEELSGKNESLLNELQISENERMELMSELDRIESLNQIAEVSMPDREIEQAPGQSVSEDSFQPVFPLPAIPADEAKFEAKVEDADVQNDVQEKDLGNSEPEIPRLASRKRGPRKFR